MPSPIYPDITGNRFDASSIELSIDGSRYIGCTECEYEQSLEPGEVRGTGTPQILGFTRGVQKVSGRLVMLRQEFQDLSTKLQALALGLLEANFLITVTYSELIPAASPGGILGAYTSLDTLVGVRFTGTKHKWSAGSSDPLTVEMPFVFRFALINGIAPMNNLLRYAIAAIAA